jgi:hypothetical protein
MIDIEDRIELKENEIYHTRNLINIFEKLGAIEQVKQFQEKVKDLEKSIEHDREVQKIEAARSGRKTWRDDALKYFLVFFGGAAFIKLIEFILSQY